MSTTWTIAIDWNRDGDFADTNEDVSSRVISATWFLGMRQPYQETADNAVLQLVLQNDDKLLSPENASSPLFGLVKPFKPIRIQSDDGSGVDQPRTHWVGWVETVQPDVGRYGKRQMKITATGVMQFYKATETKLTLQENRTTDQVIADLIKEVVVPPALSRAWIVGRVGNSEIGQSTYLADVTAYSSLETGKVTLGIAADNWVVQGGDSDQEKNAFDVYRAIGDITAAEHGKFLFDRTGKAIFWNRHHLLQGATAAATFNDTMTDMVYTYAGIEQTKNEIIVTSHPRKIGTVTTDILWELGDNSIRVDPGQTKSFYVKYEDQGKQRVGGKDLTITDIVYDQGSANITVDAKANGADIKIVNASTTTPAIISSVKIKGRKIIDSGNMEAKSVDSTSVIDYGRRTLRINLPSIDNLEKAQYIADFERDRRSQPRGEVSAVTVLSHATNSGGQQANQLALTLGDLIAVTEIQSGHSKNYYVIGEAHELTMSIPLWKTTWYLEIEPTNYPWKLGAVGRSELGVATRVTY